jgi:hypothetical protein
MIHAFALNDKNVIVLSLREHFGLSNMEASCENRIDVALI